MPEPKALPAADAFKLFARRGITMVDFKRDAKGEIIVKRTKVEGQRDIEERTPEERPLAATDILKATDYGNGRGVEIITADGKRYGSNDKSADKAAAE